MEGGQLPFEPSACLPARASGRGVRLISSATVKRRKKGKEEEEKKGGAHTFGLRVSGRSHSTCSIQVVALAATQETEAASSQLGWGAMRDRGVRGG